MFLTGFGETIVDILTVNPEFEDLASASSILDTSNYTFHAVTFGKDSDGFNFHAHTIVTTEYIDNNPNNDASSFNAGLLVVSSQVPDSPYLGSYNVSANQEYFSATYNSVPNYPSVTDTRLERGSTATKAAEVFSATIPDLGHYPNAWVDPDLKPAWNVLGSFAPPSSAGEFYYLYNAGAAQAYFELSGMFNHYGLADKDGYVTVNQTSGISNTGVKDNLSGGPCIFSSVGFHPSGGTVNLGAALQRSDAACLALFGGVNHIGVYCLDTRSMLSEGLTPPYEWNYLNNNRKYKLVGKVTTFNDLVYHEDYIPGSIQGIQILNLGGGGFLTNDGPIYIIRFKFT